MIEFDDTALQEAINEIEGVEEGLDEYTDRKDNYSLFKQVEETIEQEVTSPVLQRARDLGREYVGDRVSQIRATEGRWEGDQYRIGLTSDNTVVLAHEFGTGKHGSGNGPYMITPTGNKDALSFVVDGRPVAVSYAIHPGVRSRRFMQQAVREQSDRVAEKLREDAQQTLDDAVDRN